MRALLIILAFLLMPVQAWAEKPSGDRKVPSVSSKKMVAGEFEALVTWIIDGDSIRFKRLKRPMNEKGEFDWSSGRETECRMLHYNAPEMSYPEKEEGKIATKELIRLIKNRRVRIWGVEKDHYGRLLCEVRLMNGTYVNEHMREFLKDYHKRDIYLWKEEFQRQRPAN